MGRERGNYNLCGCASSMKLRWYIIIQPPGLCGVCYKGTTSTVVLALYDIEPTLAAQTRSHH